MKPWVANWGEHHPARWNAHSNEDNNEHQTQKGTFLNSLDTRPKQFLTSATGVTIVMPKFAQAAFGGEGFSHLIMRI
jgi:hypothetical protein